VYKFFKDLQYRSHKISKLICFQNCFIMVFYILYMGYFQTKERLQFSIYFVLKNVKNRFVCNDF